MNRQLSNKQDGKVESSSQQNDEVAPIAAPEEAFQAAQHQAVKLQQEQLEKMNRFRAPGFVGSSPLMLKVFELIEKVADTDSTVLILGESGTGKELVARALHERSTRRSKAFVPVNCGAIPSELLETELFGHVKGAYTGAHSSRVGRFTMAHEGTLFLDEIGTMPASLQVKLLRALQEKQFEPVGATRSVKSDCRVVAATNENLEKLVEDGLFREDLYYRLNVIPISLPALRERKDDIPLLLQHFVQELNRKKSYRVDGFSSEAMAVLQRYPWPGNVRELENICQRLCILKSEGVIELSDLPAKIPETQGSPKQSAGWMKDFQDFPEEGLVLEEQVQNFENHLILKALEKTGWNKNKAAKLLHMNRTTLVEKIKKRGLRPL